MNSINETRQIKEISTPFRIIEIERAQPTILKVECDKETITAYLSDGRLITVPNAWYKVLREAKLEQLKNVSIMPAKRGIYWPDLEEFLSIRAFTHGLNAGC